MVTTEGVILSMGALDDVSEIGLLFVGLEVVCGVELGFVVLWTSEVPGAALQAGSPASETIMAVSAMQQRKPAVNRCILLVRFNLSRLPDYVLYPNTTNLI